MTAQEFYKTRMTDTYSEKLHGSYMKYDDVILYGELCRREEREKANSLFHALSRFKKLIPDLNQVELILQSALDEYGNK